jgi:uncharacterized protein YmfQ (DUF2313 family)
MSGAPVLTQQDYADALSALAPQGRAWPTDSSVVQQTFAALAPTPYGAYASATNLLIDAFPATTVQLLPEWQLSLGLPDPCAGSDPTLQQEQQQILARFIAGGGQSADYYIQFAATLGYTITITEFAPFRAGINAAGQPVNGEAWAWAWEINGPTFQLEYFTVGSSSVGMPLASAVGGNALECELSRLSPAHTVLIFNL